MSKETTFGIDCPGCGNKITFFDFHHCPELAAALKEQQAPPAQGEDQPKKKRRRRSRGRGNSET